MLKYAIRENLRFSYQEIFASVSKAFSLAGRLDTRLSLYKVLTLS